MDKTIIYKKFENLRFNEKYHKYYVNGVEYKSVTKLISEFKPEFKIYEIAEKVANKKNITKDQVLTMWDCNRDFSCALGTAFHFYIEMYLSCGFIWQDYPVQIKPHIIEFHRFWDANKDKVKIIACELKIYDAEWMITGTIDFLVQNLKTGNYCIWDWKSNKKIDKHNNFANMNDPISHLSNAEYIHYSLQVSMYYEILKRAFPNLKFGQGSLIHFPFGQPYNIIKTKNLQDDVYEIINA